MSAKKTCAIFDMDGCLADTERAYIRAWGKAFKAKDIPISDEKLLSFAGKGSVFINAEIARYTRSEQTAKELRASREDFFWEFLDKGEVSLMPYAREILEFAKGKGLAIGVASSTYAEKASRILDYFNLLGYFDFRVFGDMIKNLKPAPDIYNLAVKLSGRPSAECIAFEDSAAGVMSADAAGIDVVYVPGVGPGIPDEAIIYKQIPSLREGIGILAEVI